MIVKMSKLGAGILIVTGCICALFPLIYIENPTFMTVAYSILGLIYFKCWFIFGRRLEFSSIGCTVAFLFFKKQYLWEELNSKYLLHESHKLLGRYSGPSKCVFFSKGKLPRILKVITIHSYALLCLNPARFFFLYFKPKDSANRDNSMSWGFYEIDECEFMDKLKTWGVELTIEK